MRYSGFPTDNDRVRTLKKIGLAAFTAAQSGPWNVKAHPDWNYEPGAVFFFSIGGPDVSWLDIDPVIFFFQQPESFGKCYKFRCHVVFYQIQRR
jgi:hypothetical protein